MGSEHSKSLFAKQAKGMVHLRLLQIPRRRSRNSPIQRNHSWGDLDGLQTQIPHMSNESPAPDKYRDLTQQIVIYQIINDIIINMLSCNQMVKEIV